MGGRKDFDDNENSDNQIDSLFNIWIGYEPNVYNCHHKVARRFARIVRFSSPRRHSLPPSLYSRISKLPNHGQVSLSHYTGIGYVENWQTSNLLFLLTKKWQNKVIKVGYPIWQWFTYVFYLLMTDLFAHKSLLAGEHEFCDIDF